MAIETIKFSEFSSGGDLSNDKTTVGLDATETINTKFNNPWTFLAPGTTGDRPPIAATMYYRLRFNTQTRFYEFYDPIVPGWVEIQDSDSILPLLASHLVNEGASLIGLQNQGTILNKTVQDLANAALVASTDNGTLFNGQFLDLLATGIVSNTTGTGILSVLIGSSTINAVIDDDTFATAATTNIPTALSVKNYVTSSITAGSVLLNPTANQHILTSFDLFVDAGGVVVGSATKPLAAVGMSSVGTIGSSGNFGAYTYNNVGNYANYFSYKSASATVGVYSAITSTEPIGSFRCWGDDGTQFTQACIIRGQADGTISNGVVPGSWQFLTANTSGVMTIGMTLNSSQVLILANPLLGTSGGTGVNNGTKTITLGGNLTTSGAFNSTFTMTAATSVTFPTSGTLATTAGTVSSVSGTANRITSTGGTTPVIDISASYVGQTSITTVGTVTTGVWNGTTIVVANGGTGIATATAYGLIAGGTTATGNFQSVSTGTAGQFLQSGGAAALPSFTTATFPATAGTTGTILRSNGTNWVNSTSTFADTYSSNTLLYANGANTVQGLTTGTGVITALGANVIGSGGIALSSASTSHSPVVSFTTPGDLSVSYAVQLGVYARVGNIVTYSYQVAFTPTYTTSSGQLTVSLPVNANATASSFGAVSVGGVTFTALYTYVTANTVTSVLNFAQSGSAQTRSVMSTTQFTTGTQYVLYGTISYPI